MQLSKANIEHFSTSQSSNKKTSAKQHASLERDYDAAREKTWAESKINVRQALEQLTARIYAKPLILGQQEYNQSDNKDR
jgi:hypothetical protein